MQEQILAFWAINRRLEFAEAKQDIDCFKRSGMDGVVFQPRHYPGDPAYMTTEYFKRMNQIIGYCRERQMSFWLYDENGWPSGTGDGKVIEAEPTLQQEWIEAVTTTSEKGATVLNADALRTGTIRLKHRGIPGPSAISLRAVQTFRDLIYEGYRRGLSADAFAYITGFFSDETALPLNKQVPSIPWSTELESVYHDRTNRILLDDLPALFVDHYFDDRRTSDIRIAYWEAAASCLGQIYYQTLSQWCVAHHKRFTAHIRGEENLALTIPFAGALCQVLKYVDVPMVDALERHRQNPLFPRVASTLGHVYGDGNSFCEVMGGAGWGIAPQDVVNTYRWLAHSGVNITCLHQSQSRLNAQAIRDWPPSMPKHLTWQPLFNATLLEARKAYRLPVEEPVLAVLPVRAVMASYHAWELQKTNRHKGAVQPNTMATRLSSEVNRWLAQLVQRYPNVHILDELTVEKDGQLNKAGLQVGKQHYSAIVVHPDCQFKNDQLKARLEFWAPLATQIQKSTGTSLDTGKWDCKQSNWQCDDWGENQLPIGENLFVNSWLNVDIDIQTKIPLTLKISDSVIAVAINGYQLMGYKHSNDDNYYYQIPTALVQVGSNHIEVHATSAETQPFIWLQGKFAVKFENRHVLDQVAIADAWKLVEPESVTDYRHLADAGYAFLGHEITLRKSFVCPKTYSRWQIVFEDFHAAGAFVKIDHQKPIAYWAGQKNSNVSFSLSAGKHEVVVDLFPSTFLTYGPFRYIGGDAPVISPLQYADKKNLMDPASYPEDIEHAGLNYLDTGIGAMYLTAVDQ